MRAFSYRARVALDALELVELPVPSLEPHDVLLRMRAVSLNYRDLAIARAAYGGYATPLVPLSDGAGEVVEVGSAVTRFARGDLVIPTYVPDWIDGPVNAAVARRRLGGPNDGVLAELVRVHEEAAVRAPAHLDAREAASLSIAAVTAYQVLFTDGGLRPGERVVVQGTGGVSLFVVSLARAAGAEVTVVTRDQERAARVAALGAETIDSTRTPEWQHEVLARTRGGADLVVDVVGGKGLARSIAATRVGGAVAVVGFVGGTVSELDLPALIRRVVTLRPVSAGSRASFEGLVRAMEQSKLRPVIDRVFPFEEARDAFTALEDGRPFGKIVIDVAPRE